MEIPATVPDEIGHTFPLPAGAKHPPPSGVTGAAGAPYVGNWPEDCNVGLRLAPHVIGIDVDGPEHAEGKRGPETIARLEAELGPLPFTSYSTRHGAGCQTRVLLFEVPNGLRFKESDEDGSKFEDIEVIQHHHRYIVVAPSTFKGTEYAWYGPDDQPLPGFPSRWDIEALPEAWVLRLLAPAPEDAASFSGDTEAWLKSLGDTEPDERVLGVIERMSDDSPREDMLHRQRELIGLASEGHPGVPAALSILHGLWSGRPHVSGDPEQEWQRALSDGITKFGGSKGDEPGRETVTRMMKEVTEPELARLFFEKVGSDERRKFIRGLLALGYDVDTIYETVYYIPMGDGIPHAKLYQEIHDLANPSTATESRDGLSLLTDEERDQANAAYCFVEHYIQTVSILQKPWNPIYHRLNAWTILAVMFSDLAYLDLNKGINLNLYCMPIGPSGSGKSEAREDMYHFLRKAQRWDVSIGADMSEVGLYETLNDRDGEVVWAHSDEADKVLRRLKPDSKGGVAFGSLEAAFADLYDTGHVSQVVRAGRKAEREDASGGTHVYFNLWLMGTETRITSNLTSDQVLSGFVARFISGFGNMVKRDRTAMRAKRRKVRGEDRDPYLTILGEQMGEMRAYWRARGRVPVDATDEAMDRMADAHERMITRYEDEVLWELIEPCLTRLMMIMWKAAALNALSQGRAIVLLEDVLISVREAEGWLEATLRLMRSISASDFTAKVEEVYGEIRKANVISGTALYRRMFEKSGLSDREVDEMTNNLRKQGRVEQEKGLWKVVSQ